jgi:hypothetical protein
VVAMLPQVVPELLAERQNSGKKVMQVWGQGHAQKTNHIGRASMAIRHQQQHVAARARKGALPAQSRINEWGRVGNRADRCVVALSIFMEW